MPDAHKNFAASLVATAPSPATSGTSLVVTAGQGALFPTPPFNATVWPVSAQPTTTNAEIVRVTGISTDTLTIVRAQESSSARTVVLGDQIAATITTKTLTDIETAVVDINFVIDGGGATIATGLKGYLQVNQALTIVANTLLADQSGSIVVDVFRCTYAQFDAGATHPVSGDKLTASAPPTIATATKATDSTLTGWTTTLSAGDVLAINVNSITTCQRVTLCLRCKKAA